MKIALIHAYSTRNSGDGLLVEEARNLALRAYPGALIDLVALDPDSFDSSLFDRVVHPLTGSSGSPGAGRSVMLALFSLVRGQRNRLLAEIIGGADLVIAVGGGYLRGKTAVEAVKMLAVHAVQLPRPEDLAPSIYLPQSVGPFGRPVQRFVRKRLKNASSIHCRDDVSLGALDGLRNVSRSPDLALLGMPDAAPAKRGGGGGVGLIARELTYEEKMLALASRPDAQILVQSSGRGNDDPAFYRKLGLQGEFLSLKAASEGPIAARPAVVISVRLHGALQAIRNGLPTVHLSYERKGWGAYSDIGIERYVHNAFDFDLHKVSEQVDELAADPSAYWSRVDGSTQRLIREREALVSELRDFQRKANFK